MSKTSLPPEWFHQDGILIAWPHANTDWDASLDEVTTCYVEIARNIIADELLVIVTPSAELVQQHFDFDITAPNSPIRIAVMLTNDTWARDFGAITVIKDGHNIPLDFTFNAWGMKFAANHDNLINRHLQEHRLFKNNLENHLDMVLEGGSIESDGNGTLMTTTQCLLSPNRNEQWGKTEIEHQLMKRLGAEQILWLDHGFIAGDDTDCHIDTLARFAPNNAIIYCGCNDPADEHFVELQHMKEQLASFANIYGKPFRLLELPLPDPIFDDGYRLPATYANFLITNKSVLVPTYGQPEKDKVAMNTIQDAFPHHTIKGVDCLPLIMQHGSLHCATMQFPDNTLNI